MGLAELRARSRLPLAAGPESETLPWSDSALPPPTVSSASTAPRRVVPWLAGLGAVAATAATALLLPVVEESARFSPALRSTLLQGLAATGVCVVVLAGIGWLMWRAHHVAARTLRQTANELRRGAWESAVAGLREPRRVVPSAFGDLATQVEGVMSESERRWRARVEMSTDQSGRLPRSASTSNSRRIAPRICCVP